MRILDLVSSSDDISKEFVFMLIDIINRGRVCRLEKHVLQVDDVDKQGIEAQVQQISCPEDARRSLHDISISGAAISCAVGKEFDEKVERCYQASNLVSDDQQEIFILNVCFFLFQSTSSDNRSDQQDSKQYDSSLQIGVELENWSMTLLPGYSLSVARSFRSKVGSRRFVIPALILNHSNSIGVVKVGATA